VGGSWGGGKFDPRPRRLSAKEQKSRSFVALRIKGAYSIISSNVWADSEILDKVPGAEGGSSFRDVFEQLSKSLEKNK
jgi:hypothetical protein